MLNIKADGLQVVTTLTGHSACIDMLIWDSSTRRLFSAGHDRLIIVWDIGGGQGTAYELHGHTYVSLIIIKKNYSTCFKSNIKFKIIF